MRVEELKKRAALAACENIKDGMVIGLGTGSTVFYVIEELKARIDKGLHMTAIASSLQSEQLAQERNIPLVEDTYDGTIDFVIDGVDVLDAHGTILKGGGGALTREKILAQWAKEVFWIMDETKLQKDANDHLLPIEVLPFACAHLIRMLKKEGYPVVQRTQTDRPYLTDNGNRILDVRLPQGSTMKQAHEQLLVLPGVVETGYFSIPQATAYIATQQGLRIERVLQDGR